MSAASNKKEEDRKQILVRTVSYPNGLDQVKAVVTFNSEFSNLIGIHAIDSSKAYVHNLDMVRLIDIRKGKVLHHFPGTEAYVQLRCVDAKHFLLLDSAENTIYATGIKNPVYPVQEFSNKVIVMTFTFLRSKNIAVCVNKIQGLVCFQKVVTHIQEYENYGNKFLREKKLQFAGTSFIHDAIDMVENNNGDICISVEKATTNYDRCVIVLDSKYSFRFAYEGEARNFSPSSLSVDSKNNILIVNGLEIIDLINQKGTFLRSVSLGAFEEEGFPKRISVDKDDKLWVLTSFDRLVVLQLGDTASDS